MSTNILNVAKQYDTQAKCLSYLIKLRWGKTVKCPSCDSNKVRDIVGQQGRYFCQNCKTQFSVFTDTIFEGLLIPLPKVFGVIALFLNAKSGMAAKEIQRNFEMTYKSCYYLAMRLRVGCLVNATKLHGIIEMDESYFGGRARKKNKKMPDNEPSLSGSSQTNNRKRQMNMVSVAGMVQRKGNVKTQVIEKLTRRNLLAMLKHYASKDNSILVTDGFKSYKDLDNYIDHLVINHSKEFSRGITHINTIENFWGYVKNSIKGSYKAISKKYLPFYLVEFEWKYNHRNFKGNQFEAFLKNALSQPKELYHWKAKSSKEVKEVAYGK